MKKLEDIPKNSAFKVPEGYFDRLPGVIQARITTVNPQPWWTPFLRYGLRFAIPVMAIAVAALFYRNGGGESSTEELIASIDSANLVAYLGDTDISSDDLLETVSLDGIEAEAIRENSMQEIILDDAAMDSLTNEFGADYF